MASTIKRLARIVAEKLGYQISRIDEEEHKNTRTPSGKYSICIENLYLKSFPKVIMAKLFGTYTSEAMYIIDGLYKTMKLEGDVCEFGVAQGATSALIAHEIEKTNKKIWLFDSFSG